jgi:hypothetical protein
MMRPTVHAIVPKSPLLRTALCGFACVLALGACDDRMAGTSVGTGNPTEIEIAFKDDAGTAPITGSLSVYATTQIPVEGYAPEPLLQVDVAGASQATLKATAFAALADSLWPKGSKNDSERFFNVVVTGEEQGAVLKGFTWRKADTSFGLRAEDEKVKAGVTRATVRGLLAPLVDMTCLLTPVSLSSTKDHFLFLYGTGFVIKGDSEGRFVFPSLPKDTYDPHLLSLPRKGEGGVGNNDSLFIYGMLSPAQAGNTNPLSIGDIQGAVPVPDSLKGN